MISMVDVDRHRIHRLKCPVCGSRDKKIMKILQLKEPVGYATECCNCGHVEISANGVMGLSAIIGGGCTISAVECGIANPWCPSRDCPLFKGEIPRSDRCMPPNFPYGKHERYCQNEWRDTVYNDQVKQVKHVKKYR